MSWATSSAAERLSVSSSLPVALTLSFADSEVACVSAASDGVRIRLSAAQVQRVEVPGSKPTEGYSRTVELLLPGAQLTQGNAGPPARFIGRISQGRVQRGAHWSARLPLPCSDVTSGPVRLELSFAQGSPLVLIATGIECRFEAEPNFHESLFC